MLIELISESSLRNAKINPYNKVHEEDAFTMKQHHKVNDLIVKVGKCTFVEIRIKNSCSR